MDFPPGLTGNGSLFSELPFTTLSQRDITNISFSMKYKYISNIYQKILEHFHDSKIYLFIDILLNHHHIRHISSFFFVIFMKGVFWIFFFGAVTLTESSAIRISSQSDGGALLSAERSSFIAENARKTLRTRLAASTLTVDRIHELIQSPQIAQLCYLHQFFSNVENGKPFTQEELRDKGFREWLSSHPEVFKMLAHSGSAGRQTLSVFYKIWNTADKQLTPVETSMALGAGLVADIFTIDECVAKFHFYQDAHHHGTCYPQADTLQPWEWAIVFRGKESIEDLAWAQQFIAGKKIRPEKAGSRFPGFIPYRKKNHQGISVHAGGAFYDHKPITLKLYTEYGGVCGAVSKGAAGFLRSKGVPAYHCQRFQTSCVGRGRKRIR